MDDWKRKVGIALHYCVEGRALILSSQTLNPVAYSVLTSTISNLKQSNISLALDLALPVEVHDYIAKSSANITTTDMYDDELVLLAELMADYEEIMGEPHSLDDVLAVLQNTSRSLVFSDVSFDQERESVPPCQVSRANISNFVCTQANLRSGLMLRDLGYSPNISFAETERSRHMPNHYSPRQGIGQYI